MKQSIKTNKFNNSHLSALFAGVFGNIAAPTGVQEYNAQVPGGIGIIIFASNVIKVFTIVMGLIIMFNFIKAGFDFIMHADDTGTMTKVKDRLTMSVIGIVIIAAAYTVAGLIGLIFFNNAGFILNPVFTGPTP